MGLLVEGKWQDKWYDIEKSVGKFIREDAKLRNWIGQDYQSHRQISPTGIVPFGPLMEYL